jgi:hypothetical protein
MRREQDAIKVITKASKYSSNENHVNTIVSNTVNTWQANRTIQDKQLDTSLGKLAEDIVGKFVENELVNATYLSYDNFRTNNYSKHAPFDGLIFHRKKSFEDIKAFIDEINAQITQNKFGKIDDSLKSRLSKARIFIVEIKSTRVNDSRHRTDGKIDFAKVKGDDFLTYPKYLRTDRDNSINNLEDYIKFCRNYRGLICSPPECRDKLLKDEYENMSHVYIRVYMDEPLDTAYIIGYVTKKDFIGNVVLKKMPKFDKSESALYLACQLSHAKDINLLDNI